MNEKTITEQIVNLTIEAQDISHGIYQNLESLAAAWNSGDMAESELREQLAEIKDRLSEAAEEA